MEKHNFLVKVTIFFFVTSSKSELLYREDKFNLSLVECLIKIIETQNDYFKMAIFNSPNYFKTTSEIVRRSSTPVTLNADEQHIWTSVDTRTPTNMVIVLHDKIKPVNIINNALWFSDTKFFIVTETQDYLNSVFEKFWANQVINVYSLVITNGDVLLYTFAPFKPGNCKKVKIVLIDKWTNGKFLGNGLSLIKNGQTRINFHECPVNISIVNTKPNTFFHDDCDCLKLNTSKCTKFDYFSSNLTAKCIDGIEGKIFIEIGKKFNYSATYVIPEDLHAGGWLRPIPAGVVGHVFLKRSLIGFGLLAPTIERNDLLDITVPFDGYECITFGVPKRAGPKRPTWLYLLLSDFPIETWIALSISCIILSIFLRKLGRHSGKKLEIGCLLFYIFGLSLQVASRQPKKCALRILIMTWCWGTFVLSIAYQTSMGSYLTVLKSDPEIETLKELLDSNLKITGYKEVLQFLRYPGSEGDIKSLADRFKESINKLEIVIDKIASERSIANARHSTTLKYYSLILQQARGEVHMMKECIYFYPPSFVLKKRSPLTKSVNEIVTNLKEMGITRYWRSLYLKKTPSVPPGFVKLSLNHVQGMFLILLIGYGLAVVRFAFEILYWKYNSKNRH